MIVRVLNCKRIGHEFFNDSFKSKCVFLSRNIHKFYKIHTQHILIHTLHIFLMTYDGALAKPQHWTLTVQSRVRFLVMPNFYTGHTDLRYLSVCACVLCFRPPNKIENPTGGH